MSTATEFIGLTIKGCRKKRGISQPKLGKMIGTSQSAISDIENGKRNVSIELIIKIFATLQYSFTFKILPFEGGQNMEHEKKENWSKLVELAKKNKKYKEYTMTYDKATDNIFFVHPDKENNFFTDEYSALFEIICKELL